VYTTLQAKMLALLHRGCRCVAPSAVGDTRRALSNQSIYLPYAHVKHALCTTRAARRWRRTLGATAQLPGRDAPRE
jgi:hypothetical protein